MVIRGRNQRRLPKTASSGEVWLQTFAGQGLHKEQVIQGGGHTARKFIKWRLSNIVK